jgi:hypothetical protein
VPLQSASCSYFDKTFFDRDPPVEPPPWNTLFPYLIFAKTILASVNSILLTILFVIYIGIYRTTRSQFSIGLLIFSIALLLYSLTSNPIIHRLAGFRVGGLGPFTMLPDLFTCIASAVLLYLSRQ